MLVVVVVVGFEDLAVSRVLGFSGGPGLRLHVSSISVCVALIIIVSTILSLKELSLSTRVHRKP